MASQGVQGWDRYAYSYGNPVKYIDPSGHMPIDSVGGDSGQYGLDRIFMDKEKDKVPHPDAPPDFDHLTPEGHPPPPHIDGLPDDQWEWGDWPGVGEGYRNKQDPTGTVWRPDEGYTNEPGTEGELPHWNGRVPGDTGKGINFPDNYKWGRPGQPKRPGVFIPGSGEYTYYQVYPDLSNLNIPRLPLPSLNPTATIPLIILILFAPLLAFGL